VEVLNTASKELGTLVTRFLPGEVGEQVTKYLGALEDAMEGLDQGLENFAAGDTVSAVQDVYAGLKLASAGLLPQDVQDDNTFKTVIGALDLVFKDLSETVLQFKQQLLDSNVCWKVWEARERRRPKQCPEGFHWDGEQWCLAAEKGAALLDTSVSAKRPSGAIPAVCSEEGDYSEKQGAWCYKGCPVGMENAGRRCKSACVGAYPVQSPLMCGKQQGAIAGAVMGMVTHGFRSILSVKQVTDSSGDAGAALGSTVSSLVNLGKSFTHPRCPTVGTA